MFSTLFYLVVYLIFTIHKTAVPHIIINFIREFIPHNWLPISNINIINNTDTLVEYECLLTADERGMIQLLSSIKKLLLLFDKNNIIYCYWNNNDNLSKPLNGDEKLDLIFHPKQKNKIEFILHQLRLKRLKTALNIQSDSIKLIGFDEITAKIWHLNVHFRLPLEKKYLPRYTTYWTNYILENRVYDERFSIYCLYPDDKYFFHLLESALKLRWLDFFKKINNEDLLRFNSLKKQSKREDVLKTAKTLLGNIVCNEYKRLFEKDLLYKRDLYTLQKLLIKEMEQFTAYDSSPSSITRMSTANRLMTRVLQTLNFFSFVPIIKGSLPEGAVVSIVGSDGTGKSTILKYLTKKYEEKIDIMGIYMGSGDGKSSILRYPLKIIKTKFKRKRLGKIINRNSKDHETLGSALKFKLYWFAKIIWAIVLAIEKRKKLKVIKSARKKGMLVITDRYPQVEVFGYNDGPLLHKYINSKSRFFRSISQWEKLIYKRAYVNPPDLVIKLIVPPKIAIKRKPEETITNIKAKISAVKKMNLTENSIEIDTSKNKKTTFKKVMKEIWKVI